MTNFLKVKTAMPGCSAATEASQPTALAVTKTVSCESAFMAQERYLANCVLIVMPDVEWVDLLRC